MVMQSNGFMQEIYKSTYFKFLLPLSHELLHAVEFD